MYCKKNGIVSVALFLFLISSFALAQDCKPVLFITKDSGWSGNEFYLYGLAAESACSISKIKASDVPSSEFSNFSYALVSFDAGEVFGEASCSRLRDSGLPFIYFSPHFNTVCAEALKLTSGSGFTKSLNWTFADAGFYNSSSAQVFESAGPLLMPYVSAHSDYSQPEIVAFKDPSKAYLVLFVGGLQKRAFLSFPNYENLTLTPEGRQIFAATVEWLARPESTPPTALAVLGFVKSGPFIAIVCILSIAVVALAFMELKQKNLRAPKRLRRSLALFLFLIFAVPLTAQTATHSTALILSRQSLSVSDSAKATCRVDVSGGDSNNVGLHLQADFGGGFVDIPTSESNALKANRDAWTDCDVVYGSTYCERSWVLTALSPGDVPVRCVSNSDETAAASVSGNVRITAEAGLTLPPPLNASAQSAGSQTGGNVSSAVAQNASALPAVPKDNGTKPAAASSQLSAPLQQPSSSGKARLSGRLEDADGKPLRGAIDISRGGSSAILGDVFNSEVDAGKYDVDITLADFPVKRLKLNDFDVSRDLNRFADLKKIAKPNSNFVEAFAINPLSNCSTIDMTFSYSAATSPNLVKCQNWDFANSVCNGGWVTLANLPSGTNDFNYSFDCADPAFGVVETFPIVNGNFSVDSSGWTSYDPDGALTTCTVGWENIGRTGGSAYGDVKGKNKACTSVLWNQSFSYTNTIPPEYANITFCWQVTIWATGGSGNSLSVLFSNPSGGTSILWTSPTINGGTAWACPQVNISQANFTGTGNYNLTFKMDLYSGAVGNAEVKMDVDDVNLTIGYTNYGSLNATINLPQLGPTNSVDQNKTFRINATVQCIGTNAICPNVSALARYNYTSALPNTKVNTTAGDKPFYTLQANPQSCGQLNSTAGQNTCNVEWTVNATGVVGSTWLVDVNFSSSNGNVTANDTGNAIVQITAPDTQGPTISIQVPSQNQNFSSLAVPLNFTVGDFSGVSSCRYELSNSSGSFNVSLPNCQNVTMVGVTEGSDSVKVWANDSLNNWGVSSSVSFRVDVTPPYVAVQAPSPGQVFATANVPLNFTVGDVSGVSSCKYELANSSGSYNLSLPNCQNVSAMVGVTEGSDTVRVWANDSVNNWNVSGSVSFTVDTTAPSISIQNPQNTTYATTSMNLNYTAWDLNGVSQCKYELNGVNATLATCQNTTITAIERNNTLKVWANDTSNNWNVSAMVSFTVDTTPPTIAIQNPTSIVYATPNINLNYTAGDLSGVSQCKYELNGVNASLVTCQNTTIVAAEGINAIKVWANDSLNNWNVSSSVSFTVDTTPPTISIQSPTGKIYATTGIGLNYTAWDLNNVSQCKYELNGANTTLATCQNTTITAAEGANTIKVWANDTGNNWNVSGSVSFTVDTGYPSLAINSPANQSWQRGTISVNYSAADSQAIDRCSWRWRNSTGVWAAYSAINCGTNLAFNFNTAGCGDNSTAICVVEVRANDTANNVNSSEVYLKVDNTAPSVDVSQPAGGWFNGSVVVRIAVNDSTSGASSVVFFNGSAWASAVLESGNSNNGVWNGTIRTNAFVDGTAIQINANATDLLGNNGSDASVPTVQVDNNPPKVLVPALNVSSPTNKNANIFVNSSFNDNGGQGLAANVCTLYVAGATVVSPYAINNSAGASGAVNGTISAVLNDGTNNVYLNCSDLQGWTGSNYTSLIVDTTPPAITIQSPSNATYNYAAIALNFTGFDLNGVSFCKYEIKNSTGFFNVSLSNCQNATLSGVTEGGNSVKVWANDSVNNWNSSAAVSFTLDTTVPGINIQAPSQGQNFSTLNVSLNFTVFDVGGVSSCRYELSNSSGVWNVSLPNCQNVTMVGVTEGANSVKVWANDSVNNWNSSAAVSFTVDTRPPAWVEVPQSQVIAYGYAFYYDVNATDSGVGVDKYFINDSTNFRINPASGVIENNTLLAIGSYLLNVSVNDTLNNVNSTVITVTVKDLNSPVWTEVPSSQNVEYGTAFYYDLNASDNVAVDKFWLNDSTNFRINVTSGVVENKTLLGLGVWLLNVSVNDTSGNGNSSLFNVTVRDTRAPSWDQAPANQVVEFGSAFYYDLNASDLLLDKYWINDSTNFRINASTGVVRNNTPLAVGVYLLNASANDTSGNRNSSLFSVTVQDTTPPSISNQNSNVTALNVNENFCINATVADLSGVDAVKAEVWNTTAWANYTMANSSGVCNAGGSVYAVSIQAAAEGTWNYSKVFANDTRTNLQAYDFADMTISVTSFLGTVSLNITQPANGSDYNLTYAFTATINASCSLGLCGATNITLQYCSGAGCSDWAAVSPASPVNTSEPAKKLCSSNLLAGQTCSVSWNVSGISGGTYRLNGVSQSVEAPAANASAGMVYINALNLTVGQPVAGSMFSPGTNFTLSGTAGCLGRFCGQVSVYSQDNESGPWMAVGGRNLTIGANPIDCGQLNYTNSECTFSWNVSGKPKEYSIRLYANNTGATLGNASGPVGITVAGQSLINLASPAQASSVFMGEKIWVNSSITASNWTIYNCNATLYNQTGLDVVFGARTQPLGNVSIGSPVSANWQLNGTQLGLYNLTVNVTCGYGANSSISVYPIEVTQLSSNVTDFAYAEKVVVNGEEWLHQSSDSGLNWWRNGRDEYLSFNGSSATNSSFVGRWYVIANVSGTLYPFDFSNISWGIRKVGVSGNSTYVQYVGETGYPKIRVNFTQTVNSTSDLSSLNVTLQNLEPFTVDGISLKWMVFNFSISGDAGDDVLVFTNSTGQAESYPMNASTSLSLNMSRFGATSATFRDPDSGAYGKIFWEPNMSTGGGKAAFNSFRFEAGGNFSLNLTFDFGSFLANAVKGFDPGSGLEQPGLVQRATISSMEAGESPPPTYTDVTAVETDNSLATTSDIRKVSAGVTIFKIKMLNESLAYSWIFLQMNITNLDQTPYQTRLYAYNSDNVTMNANPVLYNVSAAGSVNVDITNITHQQDGLGYLLIRLAPDANYVTVNNRKLTIAEVRFNTTVNSPPVAYWSSPANGTWYARSAAAVKINCSASDDLAVRNVTFQQSSNGIAYANVSTDTVYADNDWNWTYVPSTNTGPCNSTNIGTTGTCYLGCFAKDGNNVDSAVNYSTIRIDGDAPTATVGVTGVSKTTGWLTGSRTVTCSASDSGSGVNSSAYAYEYTLDNAGATGWTLISGCTSNSCFWDTSALNDANVWVRCNSTDNVSNVGTDSANYAGIDNTLPGAQVQSPSNVTYATAAVALNYTFGDSLSGVSSCRYEITNSSGSFNVSIANCQNTTLSGVTNGANSVKIWLNDSVNLWNSSAPVSFTVDTVAPSVIINSPSNQSWQRGTVAMNYTAIDAQSADACSWRWHNATGAWSGYSPVTCGSNLAFSFNTANCGDNSSAVCVVEVRANDTANNVNSSEAYLRIDNTAPSVNVTQPASGWFNGSVIVRITANDSTSGASSVIFYNGSAWASAVLESGNSYNGVWNGTIRTNAFADGTSIQINANATDVAGNSGSDASVPTVQVDNNPPRIFAPTLNVSNPTNKNANIFVNSTFNDNGGQGVSADSCLLYVTGNTSVSPYLIKNAGGTSGAVNGTMTATLNDGTNYIYVNCTDQQGWTGSNYTSLLVDTQGPISTLDRPANGTNITSASYLVNASISGLNPASWVMFEYYDGAWHSACNDTNGAPYECSWGVSGLPDARNYQVRVRANDTLGNLGAYDAHTNITIDRTPPSAVLDAPVSGAILTSGPIFLNASSSSDAVGVYSVSFYYSPAGANSWTFIGTNTTGKAYSWASGFPSDGSYDLNVTVTDAVGWQNSSKNTGIMLNLVNDPPVCNVLYPNASGITVNGTIKVNASANDTDPGDYVVNVTFEYSSNAGGSWTAIGTNTSSNLTYYEMSWDTRGGDDSSQYLVRCTARDTLGASGSDTSDNTFTVLNNLVNITQVQDTGPVVTGAKIQIRANVSSNYGSIAGVWAHIRQSGGQYTAYTMADTGCNDAAANNIYCYEYATGASIATTYSYYINATDGTYRSVKGAAYITGANVSPGTPANFSTTVVSRADPLEIRSNFGPYYAGDKVLLVFTSRDLSGLPLANQNMTLVVYYPNGTILWGDNATNGGSGYYFYNNTLPANAPVGNYLINLTMLYDSKTYADFASFLVQSPAGLTQAQAQQLSSIQTLSTEINQTTKNVKELAIESVVRVKAGDPYNATLYYYDATHALADPAGNISVILYDPNGTAIVTANATRVGLGKYRFGYGTANTTASGGWKLDASTGDTAATMYFYVVGGPFDVIITGMPDTFVPGVAASVTLLNTGDPKDVTLYWWTEYLNGTKVVTASETFLAQSGYIYRNLSLDHAPTGEFYFKVLLRYSGEEEASALRQFYATTPSSLALVKTLAPDLMLARTVETISVNLSLENTAAWDALRSINMTDEVPYDFTPPPSSAVQLWYLNSTAYTRVTSGYSVVVSNIDSDPNIEVQVSIPEMGLTNIGQNLGAGEYLFLVYSMNSSRMAPNTTRGMNSTAAALDLNLKGVAANTTSNITAANAILVARKKIFADPNYPAKIFVNVTLTALGGTISGIAIADYLPEGTGISYVNVTYINSTGPSRQLYNSTDFLIEPPFQTTLPDGARVDVYQYNFSINNPVNWGNNLYENDSIELLYNATIIGGGTWILPTIIGGYDPVYKQHIRTEAYSFHRVPLFDIILELATKVVSAGESVKGKLKLINMGGPTAQVDVLINYAIKTMSGDLVTERSKTVAVLKEKEEDLSLPVPSTAKPGMYTFEALMTYTGREAMSTDVFEVKGTGTEGQGISPYWIYGAAVLAIVALLAVRAGKIFRQREGAPAFARPTQPAARPQSAYDRGVQKAAGPSVPGISDVQDLPQGPSTQKKQGARANRRRSAKKR